MKDNEMQYILRCIMIVTCLLLLYSCKKDSEKSERLKSADTNIAEKKERESRDAFFENYVELETFEGDLNLDNTIDKIVVYEKGCDSVMEGSTCRRLAIFLNERGEYKLYGFNDKLIECSDCGGGGVGDPFRGITIKGGYFSVQSLYGASDKTFIVITFKYDKRAKDFYLYKEGQEDYSSKLNANGSVKVSTELKTEKDFGKILFCKY